MAVSRRRDTGVFLKSMREDEHEGVRRLEAGDGESEEWVAEVQTDGRPDWEEEGERGKVR